MPLTMYGLFGLTTFTSVPLFQILISEKFYTEYLGGKFFGTILVFVFHCVLPENNFRLQNLYDNTLWRGCHAFRIMNVVVHGACSRVGDFKMSFWDRRKEILYTNGLVGKVSGTELPWQLSMSDLFIQKSTSL